MVFSSTEFIWCFLPVVMVLYFLCYLLEKKTNHIKNFLLLISSLIFYAWGEPVYIILMLASIVFNYLMGVLMGKKQSKWLLAVAVLGNLGCLGLFKYLHFFLTNLGAILHTQRFDHYQLALPIGISFYTFQALSYVIDVYRGTIKAQKNPLDLALYISFFPQLIAGPIVKYRDIETQLEHRVICVAQVSLGMRRFVYGLGKKVIISNTMAEIADTIYGLNAGGISTPVAWLGAICYLFQIYYDFSGYSDMAIGLGKIFGFDFPENFNFPYLADSIRDFWRRWHISLSSWFKEYLYIPLGGNRKGNVRTYLNLIIVFFCTGLWHGANWTFVVWGLFHGAFQLLERGPFGTWLAQKAPKAIRHLYALLVVTVGWVFFRADTLGDAVQYIGNMFRFRMHGTFLPGACLNGYNVTILMLAILLCGMLQKLCPKIYGVHVCKKDAISSWDLLLCLVIALWAGTLIICGTYNPFIYFQF